MWYLRSLERASVIQKLTILERKNCLVLSNTRVPVSGTWSILFPTIISFTILFQKQQENLDFSFCSDLFLELKLLLFQENRPMILFYLKDETLQTFKDASILQKQLKSCFCRMGAFW